MDGYGSVRIYDVTLPISQRLPTWPGEPGPAFEVLHALSAGDPFNVTVLHLGSHTGTHVDAPRHFLTEGTTVDQLPLETLVGDAWVCQLSSSVRMVTGGVLEAAGIPEGTRRLLLKTANSSLWDQPSRPFSPDYVSLSPEGAEWVGGRGIALLGIDYLSVDPTEGGDFAAHKILLGQGVVVVEGLDLRAVTQGTYHLCCLPMKIVGAEGAPARVVLAG